MFAMANGLTPGSLAAETVQVEPSTPERAAVSFELGGETVVLISWPLTGGGPPDAVAGLTRSESEVVELALEGLSNQEIARVRGTSTGTVANQLAAAYRKLGVGSRSGLSAWAARMGRAERSPR
jgi:DNA-binding CsgD family transcriptional regulator